ncbi:MAG: hypothetical protein MJZ12_01400 [Prevotella sp.]|nr:hypothetical protein [Prevotella sp.]
MRARTNLTGAVEGSLVIFDNGYQGKVIIVEDARVKVSVPLRSGNGVKLNLWLDKNTGKECGLVTLREVKQWPASTGKPIVDKAIKTQHSINKALADITIIEVKDYIIQKVEKRKYVVFVDLPTCKTAIEKTFKSITAANEWCAIHLKKI